MPLNPVIPALACALVPALVLAAPVSYEKEILPFLKDNCVACHNKTTTKAGLNMETPELMRKGGENGEGLVAGDGGKSLIWQAAAGKWDSEMPPKGNKVGAVPLDEAELALLKQWIDEGAHHSGKVERRIAWEPLPAAFSPIFASAVSPDGSLAAAARGNQVSVYHVTTGALVTKLTDPALIKSGLYKNPGVAHRDIVPVLTFTRDGQRLLSGSFREVKVWKQAALTPRPVAAPASAIPGKLKLDMQAVAAGTVSLMESSTGRKLHEFKPGAKVSAAALSDDERRVATAGEDHKIKIWDAVGGKVLIEISGDIEAARRLAAKADELARATVEAAWRNEMIKKTEKEEADLKARLKKAGELEGVAKKSLEEKKKDLQAKTDGRAAADKALKEVDGQVAAVTAPAKADAALLKKQADAREKADKAAAELKTAQEGLQRAETAVADAAEEIQVVTKAQAKAAEAVASAKAAAVASQKAQETAASAKVAEEKALVASLPAVQALAFSPDGTQVAALLPGPRVQVWSAVTGAAVASVALPANFSATVLAWPTAEGCVAYGSGGGLLIPDASKAAWTLERVLGGDGDGSPITDRVNALSLSPDGQTLAAGSGEPSRSGDISLWEMASGRLKAKLDERHLDTVLALDFSPDGRLLASGGADKAVRVTELTSGKMVKLFEGHTHHVLGLSWRADGRLLASSGADNVVKVWDWTAGDRRRNIDGWDKEVSALRYLGGGDVAATSSGDGKVRLVSSEGAQVKVLPGVTAFMNTLSASRTGGLVAAGGDDGVLHVWDVASGKTVQRFEAVMKQP
jgi:WD40 repeat protein